MKITIQQTEERVIGAIIFDGRQAAFTASNFLDETDFSDPSCSILFGVCLSLASQHKGNDALSIQGFLLNNADKLGVHFQKLKGVTDTKSAIEILINRAVDLSVMHSTKDYSFDLISWCHYLKEEAQRKKATEVIFSIGSKLNFGEAVDSVIAEGARELLSLSAKSHHLKPFRSLEDAFREAIIETQEEFDGKMIRLSTGFSELDSIIYGLEKGRLYCLAAEEKIGKSLLSYQIGLNVAQRGNAVAIVSMEMRASEIAKRFAGVNSGQDVRERLRLLQLQKEDVKKYPLFIRDGSASQSKVLTIAHKLYVEKHIELLIVDYLQLIELNGKDRVNEINDFVAKLKGLAMDLEIPVILIAAVLNKQLNNRSDRKPTPADIRDTGRLANDADCTMFLWKPDEQDENYIELFVARSRYSQLGKLAFCLDRNTLRLSPTSLKQLDCVPLQQYQSRRF